MHSRTTGEKNQQHVMTGGIWRQGRERRDMGWAGPAFHQDGDSREDTRGEGGEGGQDTARTKAQGFPTTLFCFSHSEHVLSHLCGLNQMKSEPLQGDGWKEQSIQLPTAPKRTENPSALKVSPSNLAAAPGDQENTVGRISAAACQPGDGEPTRQGPAAKAPSNGSKSKLDPGPNNMRAYASPQNYAGRRFRSTAGEWQHPGGGLWLSGGWV